MSEPQDTFIDRCLRGEAAVDDIDRFVDDWHSSASDTSIEAFLGMTRTEYAQWVRDPDTLARIIESRHESLPKRGVMSER